MDSFVASIVDKGERLDRFLVGKTQGGLSRSRIKELIEAGAVTVDDMAADGASQLLKPGQTITIDVPPPSPAMPVGEAIALNIVHEDADLLVIDKPAGLVVHPAAGNRGGTLVNALIAHCGASLSGIGGVARPGIVHRLDKDTSGLMVVAKTDRAHRALSAQFADHGRSGPLQRSYAAFVWGAPRDVSTIETGIERSRHNREKMAAVALGRGRAAITHVRLVEAYGWHQGKPISSRVECRLETGRTHQIRVHMAHVGHPLLGDRAYGAGFKTKSALLGEEAGGALARLDRQALHARLLGFQHPTNGEVMLFESPLPADLETLAAALATL